MVGGLLAGRNLSDEYACKLNNAAFADGIDDVGGISLGITIGIAFSCLSSFTSWRAVCEKSSLSLNEFKKYKMVHLSSGIF